MDFKFSQIQEKRTFLFASVKKQTPSHDCNRLSLFKYLRSIYLKLRIYASHLPSVRETQLNYCYPSIFNFFKVMSWLLLLISFRNESTVLSLH